MYEQVNQEWNEELTSTERGERARERQKGHTAACSHCWQSGHMAAGWSLDDVSVARLGR